MAVVVELPRLSDTMEEGTVATWKIQVGDKVKRGQVIAEIETDKATMEFESFDPGTVLALVVGTGETLPIGTPIAVLGEPGEDPQPALAAHGGGASANDAPAAPVAPAPVAQAPAPAPVAQVPVTQAAAAAAPDLASQRIPASPVARKLAREGGLSLAAVQGSGPNGRVVKSDVEQALAGGQVSSRPLGQLSQELDEHGRPYLSHPSHTTALTQMRKAIARRMVQSQQEVPHFYLTMDVDMEAAASLRAQYNLAVTGTKVSYNDMLILATAKALREHPNCNATFAPDGMTTHGDIHVGVAVAVEDGLVVPVVRYAEQKSLRAISKEVRDLGKRAKKKTLHPNEMSGSTFTVSNLGMFGIDNFSAVVNPGEGGILAVGAVAEMPVAVDGELCVRKRMKMTLSCDHRVIDGAVGAMFLQTLKDYLESPMKLLA